MLLYRIFYSQFLVPALKVSVSPHLSQVLDLDFRFIFNFSTMHLQLCIISLA